MKLLFRLLIIIAFMVAFMLLLTSCNDPFECDMTFEAYKTEDFKIFVRGNFPADTRFEIWASHQQSLPYPIPGLFLSLGNQSDYTGNEMVSKFQDYYKETFHYECKEGEYIYVRIRIQNSCGYSAFKTYMVRINYEIKEAGI
jgi:hypothetical protein